MLKKALVALSVGLLAASLVQASPECRTAETVVEIQVEWMCVEANNIECVGPLCQCTIYRLCAPIVVTSNVTDVTIAVTANSSGLTVSGETAPLNDIAGPPNVVDVFIMFDAVGDCAPGVALTQVEFDALDPAPYPLYDGVLKNMGSLGNLNGDCVQGNSLSYDLYVKTQCLNDLCECADFTLTWEIWGTTCGPIASQPAGQP